MHKHLPGGSSADTFCANEYDKKGQFDVISDKRCPRCGEETLRTWDELNDDERQVVQRLPDSAGYDASEREALHRWCTRCWFESTSAPELEV